MTRVNRDQSPNPARVLSSFSQLGERMSSSTSAAANTATPSPIPAPAQRATPQQQAERVLSPEATPIEKDAAKPKKQTLCPHARFRIHFDDVNHPAMPKFMGVIPLANLLEDAVRNVQIHLFTPPSPSTTTMTTTAPRPPPQHPTPTPHPTWTPQEVRSLTLILRNMGGVAYTTGTELDEAHKEIHLSLNYVHDIIDKFYRNSKSDSDFDPSTTSKHDSDHEKKAAASFVHEMRGVVTHEAVHAFQHNAHSTCPGGLIEGIADYVRMKSGLGAEHWNPWPANSKTRGDKWDSAYQKTAWFLDWVEVQPDLGGLGCVGRLNARMKKEEWQDGKLWKEVMGGVAVEECWDRYVKDWDEMNRKHEREEQEEEDREYKQGLEL